MPVCPACHEDHRTRKEGHCPGCGAEVILFEGGWYLAGQDTNPPLEIVEAFEAHVRKQLSVPYQIPRKSGKYQRAIALAKRMLEDAGGDLELALAAVEIAFTHPKLNWKTRTSFLSLTGDFDVALAIAAARQSRKDAKAGREKAVFEQITQGESIFS